MDQPEDADAGNDEEGRFEQLEDRNPAEKTRLRCWRAGAGDGRPPLCEGKKRIVAVQLRARVKSVGTRGENGRERAGVIAFGGIDAEVPDRLADISAGEDFYDCVFAQGQRFNGLNAQPVSAGHDLALGWDDGFVLVDGAVAVEMHGTDDADSVSLADLDDGEARLRGVGAMLGVDGARLGGVDGDGAGDGGHVVVRSIDGEIDRRIVDVEMNSGVRARNFKICN